ncbi:hypothetical protein PoB_006036700 [Plakobranchus ocellatus]|uniref:Uncharacterized protein n=1 Tax=Plakobranchus ocellatus TaxID=259542 RepID=A0AAV4CPQ8_9GAST|nr:hypothetical protein PoB_006036700 [Plakobranchus ocellatus]
MRFKYTTYVMVGRRNCFENNNSNKNNSSSSSSSSINTTTTTTTTNNNNNNSIASCYNGKNNKVYYRTDQNNIQNSSIKTIEFGQDSNDKTIYKNSIEQNKKEKQTNKRIKSNCTCN